MSIRIINYPANGTFLGPIYGSGIIQKFGNTFTPSIDCSLATVNFVLYRVGSMTGNATVSLYAVSGTPGSNAVPTGGVLAVSNSLDVSTITTSTSGAQYAFTFTSPPSLTAGTTYAVIISPPSGNSGAYLNIDEGDAVTGENSIYWSSSAWMADGTFVAGMSVDVNVGAPTADFSANTTLINNDDSVVFIDASTNTLPGFTEYSYDFGDGDTSTDQNPTHQYSSPGTYTVMLTVTTDGSSDTVTKNDYITVIEPRTITGIGSMTGVDKLTIS